MRAVINLRIRKKFYLQTIEKARLISDNYRALAFLGVLLMDKTYPCEASSKIVFALCQKPLVQRSCCAGRHAARSLMYDHYISPTRTETAYEAWQRYMVWYGREYGSHYYCTAMKLSYRNFKSIISSPLSIVKLYPSNV